MDSCVWTMKIRQTTMKTAQFKSALAAVIKHVR